MEGMVNHDYADIRDKIGMPPSWFDEHAVPRYCDFHPGQCANIYAREAVLALISCQGCGHEFEVAFTWGPTDIIEYGLRLGGTKEDMAKAMKCSLANSIRDKGLHYGDPPNIGCCAAGPTMNSEPRKVLQYWKREKFDWVRDAELEVAIDPEWVSA